MTKLFRYLRQPNGRKRIRQYLYIHYLDALSPRAIIWKIYSAFSPSRYLYANIGKGLKVRVRPGDVIGRRLYVRGSYEPEVMQWIQDFLEPNMTFFDIGANLGIFSLLAAKQVGSNGQIHAFEPSLSMISELAANLSTNSTQNVKVNNVAVGDSEGQLEFPRYEVGSEAYGSIIRETWPGTKITGTDIIPMLTLDNYMVTQQIQSVNLIKMDIEGAEYLALQGATDLLSRVDRPAIILELSDFNMQNASYTSKEVMHFLENFGYSIFLLNSGGLHAVENIDEMPLINTTLVALNNEFNTSS